MANDTDLAIDPNRVIDTRDEEDQADVRVFINVLVGLEKPVACNVREQQVFVVDHFYEPGFAAFGGCVTSPFTICGCLDYERSGLDEFLNVRSQVSFKFQNGPLGRRTERLVEPTVADAFPPLL